MKKHTYAVVGHECDVIVEFPAVFRSGIGTLNERTAKSAFCRFPMGVSALQSCISKHGREKNWGAAAIIPTPTAQARHRRFELTNSGDEKADRLVISAISPFLFPEKGTTLFSGNPSHSIYRTTQACYVDLAIVYWNINHIYDSESNAAELCQQMLDSIPAGIVILQLSATESSNRKSMNMTMKHLNALFGKNRPQRHLIVVTNSSSLEFMGVPLHRESSWERFADDVRGEMQRFSGGVHDEMQEFSSDIVDFLNKCDCVVIRGSDEATTVFRRDSDNLSSPRESPASTGNSSKPGWVVELFYPVTPKVIPMAHVGFLVGSTSLLTSAIATQLIRNGIPEDSGSFKEKLWDQLVIGLKRGVRSCVYFEERGYFDEKRSAVDKEWHIRLMERVDAEEGSSDAPTIAHAPVGSYPDWSLTQTKIRDLEMPQWLKSRVSSDWQGNALANAALMASHLVRFGVRKTAIEFGFPFARIGNATIVDRFEFEQYMEIQTAMRSYLSRSKVDISPPLSLAVFGKPGSGKSFGIKQLPKTIGIPGLTELVEANVSQFESVDDLAVVLHKARDVALHGQIPLVLWDEFDCEKDGKAFGWFRYFLAPMQDGIFKQGQMTYRIGSAIFVFIGGINHDFNMFEGRMRDQEFIQAKGPDFASRIRPHLDIRGIARENSDQVYLLRRAVFLRNFLLKYQKGIVVTPSNSNDRGNADLCEIDIAPEVLRAFLMVKDFRHGVRSLEAIVQMSSPSKDQSRLLWSALPSLEQLEGHVSAREFDAINDDVMPLAVFGDHKLMLHN